MPLRLLSTFSLITSGPFVAFWHIANFSDLFFLFAFWMFLVFLLFQRSLLLWILLRNRCSSALLTYFSFTSNLTVKLLVLLHATVVWVCSRTGLHGESNLAFFCIVKLKCCLIHLHMTSLPKTVMTISSAVVFVCCLASFCISFLALAICDFDISFPIR